MIPTTILLALYLKALPACTCPLITARHVCMNTMPSMHSMRVASMYTITEQFEVLATGMSGGRDGITRNPAQGPAYRTYLK